MPCSGAKLISTMREKMREPGEAAADIPGHLRFAA